MDTPISLNGTTLEKKYLISVDIPGWLSHFNFKQPLKGCVGSADVVHANSQILINQDLESLTSHVIRLNSY